MKPPRFSNADVELLGKTRDHDGYFKIDTYRLRHKHFDGGWSGEVRREIFERGHAVAVLPYDPHRDTVILIEQFRAGAYAASRSHWFDERASPWLYEVVAGIIDPGEKPEDVAHRETLEETGERIKALWPVSHYMVSPGGTTESVFVYVGHADTSDVTGLHGLDGEDEDIRPFVLALDDAYAAIEGGQIYNSAAIIALQWLKLNRDRVRAAWH